MNATKAAFEYISNYYGEEVYIGRRVEYTDTLGTTRKASVCGAKNQYIKLHFDGDKKPHQGVFHPTSGIKYL
jgi:hypothetical protein